MWGEGVTVEPVFEQRAYGRHASRVRTSSRSRQPTPRSRPWPEFAERVGQLDTVEPDADPMRATSRPSSSMRYATHNTSRSGRAARAFRKASSRDDGNWLSQRTPQQPG